jgi:hypothetical protein
MLEFLLSRNASRVSRLRRLLLNFVFANTQEEESIYPLTITEIAEAQSEDADLKRLVKAEWKT